MVPTQQSKNHNDLRHRSIRKDQWDNVEENTAFTASSLRDSFKQLTSSSFSRHIKKPKSAGFRSYFFYGSFFIAIAVIVTLYTFVTANRPKSVQTSSDALQTIMDTFRHQMHSLKHHLEILSSKKAALEKVNVAKKNWKKKVTQARHEDVINDSYDMFAISIGVQGGAVGNDGLLQQSLTTFLRQVKNLQISSETGANSFQGGRHVATNEFKNNKAGAEREGLILNSLKGFFTSEKLEWFIQVDQETYLFLENVKQYLKDFDPNSPVLIHNFDIVNINASNFVPLPSRSGWFPVSIMSRKAMELFNQKDYEACLVKYAQIKSQETVFVKCLEEIKIRSVQEAKIHSTEPDHDFFWPSDPCTLPLSISQLSPTQLSFLYKAGAATGKAGDGTSYRWDDTVTYATVFHHTFTTLASPTPGIDRHSAAYSLRTAKKSGKECLDCCISDADCLSWTFDKGLCYISDRIGVVVRREGVVSGLISSRYNCEHIKP